jgi:hypothetical protein
MTLSGHCRCRAVSYAVEAAAFPSSYACHCLDCQTQSGSAFTIQVPLKADRLSFDGNLINWDYKDSRDALTTQRFCALCRTRLYSTNAGRPGIAVLRGGTLDNSDQLFPKLHIWIKRKQRWIGLPADAETYQESAPVDRVRLAFAGNFL